MGVHFDGNCCLTIFGKFFLILLFFRGGFSLENLFLETCLAGARWQVVCGLIDRRGKKSDTGVAGGAVISTFCLQ